MIDATQIKLLVLDVDGVMTPGDIIYDDTGHELKRFNVRDGLGIKLLQNTNVHVAVITGRQSNIVTKRMAELGIEHVFQGQENKRTAYHSLLKTLHLTCAQTAYMGDDLPDLPFIQQSGLGLTVADAPEIIQSHADWISPSAGGFGAVRDACEMLMRQQGTWASQMEQYTHAQCSA